MTAEPNPCPLCGALPCDWANDPHKAEVGLCWTLAKIREALGVGEKPMLDELPGIVAALVAENERLRKACTPSWFYHPDYGEVCLYSPHEVIDDYYDPMPGKHVFEVTCATSLPSIWCAVHCLTEEEQERMDTDNRFILTEHETEAEARAALGDEHD